MVINFENLAFEWLEEKKESIKESSVGVYFHRINSQLIPYFKDHKSIKNNDVQDFILKQTEKGLSKRSIRDNLIVLDCLLKFGTSKGMDMDFDINVLMPTILNSRTKEFDLKAFSLVETRKLRKYLVENLSEDIANLAIAIALSSGLRIGEVTGLKYGDFDFENEMISISRTAQRMVVVDENFKSKGTKIIVGTPKTKSSQRTVPVQKEILKYVSILNEFHKPDDFIFMGKYSKQPMDNRLLRDKYMTILKNLNLPQISFHGLRHSFASNCIASGVDVKTTSAMLGHSDIKMTLDIYTHPSFEQKKAAVNKLGKLFS
ncbi:tyrosine-type recombinase/integrase [Chryseobacterium aquaticum]|uniref:Tyr recombinase domain-containing protein n=1 Tax=Chryseobacterium aquaticum subsp. greenlandense TaxID=345663 RepID=A0A117KAD4_9FLAO|nr:site-specific integrase [Chryseobacterium aquaticum]KUJ54015.1 hypothetical protein AR686_17665 [Chryseobacterium aquaticum subsp. greenlandense]